MAVKTGISVVIPVMDEEKNISILYDELRSVLLSIAKSYEIIFVDDGSTDSSFKEMEKLRKKDKRVKIIKFKKNFGQSAALQAGFDYCSGDMVASMDADLQNDPNDIPKMIKNINGWDCVCGWRKKRKDNFSKKIMSRIASLVRRPFINTNIHDFGCTLRVYRKECVKDLELFGEMHRYIPPLLMWKGYRVAEMKVNHRERKYGSTKYSFQRVFKGFMDMLNMWFWQKYSQKPLHIFGGLGLASGLLGILGGIYAFYLKIFYGVDLSNTALPLFSVLMVMIGVQFFISGLLADISMKNYYSLKKRKPYNVEKWLNENPDAEL